MWRFQILLVILILFVSFSNGNQITHGVGPLYPPKNSPRYLVSDNQGNLIIFQTVDSGCETQSQIQITSYTVASQLVTNNQNWQVDLACNNQDQYFAAGSVDPTSGTLYFLILNNHTMDINTVNSTGITTLSTISNPNYEALMSVAGLASGGVYISNEAAVLDVHGNVIVASPGTNLAMISDGTALYVLVHMGSVSYELQKIVNGAVTASISFSTGVDYTFFLGNAYTPENSTFQYQRGIMLNGEAILVAFTNPSNTLEVYSINAYLNATKLAISKTFSSTESLVDMSASIGSGQLQVLTNLVTVVGGLNFNYTLYSYNSSNSLIATTPIQPGVTQITDLLTYIAVVSTNYGMYYVIRDQREALGTTNELFLWVFTLCDATDQFGKTCGNCTCESSQCDWGEYGTGLCLACDNQVTAGANCQIHCDCMNPTDSCSNGITGNGQCTCPDDYTYGFDCNECIAGHYILNEVCTICSVYYYCVNSTKFPCPGNLVAGLSYCLPVLSTTATPTATPTGTPTATPTPRATVNDDVSKFPWLDLLLALIFAVAALVLITGGTIYYNKRIRHYQRLIASDLEEL